ncbi:hypothetical protein [Nitratiruptor tergarcus]|uniref:Uncharacterized protein n=1 Tax=Nitratiruptor tergarcus DSM 16512 TaxID=1069081 RepID=A0A1W1WRI9_9BACT|nr:hypothetical protein [Nitratiruptor tergarcus]SMC08620.1 hypothetical protein SAMN05660197_0377 [Nitratiruptor tergarcus DSM 16512]
MELLPLPPFHHALLFGVFSIFCIVIVWILMRRKKREPLPKLRSKEDIYTFSKQLQLLGNDAEIQKLLQDLAQYKYSPHPPKLPKDLRKKALVLYKRRLQTQKQKGFLQLLQALKKRH